MWTALMAESVHGFCREVDSFFLWAKSLNPLPHLLEELLVKCDGFLKGFNVFFPEIKKTKY